MESGPSIGMVIPTRGRPDLLSRTLESIARVRRPQSLTEVWVIENGGPQCCEQVCRDLGEILPIRYTFLSSAGRARALQYAVDRLEARLAIFLDDDVRLDEGFLEAYVNAVGDRVGGYVLGGAVRIDYEDGEGPEDWLKPFLPASAVGWEPSPERPFFLGANLAAFVQDIRAVGGFDETLGTSSDSATGREDLVGEETDLVRRLEAFGCQRVCVPDAVLWHWVPPDRCSPEWALERAHRNAFTDGLVAGRERRGRRVFGVPLWGWRTLGRGMLQVATSTFSRDKGRRFRATWKLQQGLGFVRGARRARTSR